MGLLLLGLPEAVFPLLLLPLLQGGGVVKDQGKSSADMISNSSRYSAVRSSAWRFWERISRQRA